ncbi:hypothetical protein [Ammoniphilus sp. 3BR4]|uniref:hypothetical protein n=1 Tax=Ammoniphilus sp. 3BR4 TaxID=3158265 RepID=UPI003467D7FA
MWATVGILFISGILAMMEVPSLFKKKLRKELWVFSILLVCGTGLSIAMVLNKEIPNPLDWITALYKPFSDFLYGLLK